MTFAEETLLKAKSVIQRMPEQDRTHVRQCAAMIRNVVEENNDHGLLALGLVLAEFEVKHQ